MSRLGSILNKQIKPKETIPDNVSNCIMMNRMLMEQHNYLVSLLPKPKDGCIIKFIKKIFS